MSEHATGLSKIKTESCVCGGYESAWLSRWTRSDTDPKRSTEVKLPEDGQLSKESTGTMKLKGKMLSRVHDPDSDVPSVEIIPDMNKEPPIVSDREDWIDGHKGETSRSATQSNNGELFLDNTNTKMLSECKRIWSDSETNSRSQAKRLKTNTSDYIIGDGTNKSMMVVEEGPSGNNVNFNYYFHRVFRINKPGARRNQKHSTSQIKNLNMGGREDVNPWIKRWCTKKAAETHEPRGEEEVNPKDTALEKQFPSIAAMALMGKALSGFKPSGLIKTNSLFIWNTHEQRRKHSSC